jgi:hypothetical protein
MEVLDNEVTEKTLLMRQNQEILSKIADIEGKISSFDQTQAILDSATAGAGVWKNVISKVSDFCGKNSNLWISKLSSEGGRSVAAEGYSLSRNTLTDFASSIENSLLKSMTFEELREKSAYKFNLNFNTSNQQNQNE